MYAGITYVETYLYDSDVRHKQSAEAVGGGAMFAVAKGKGIQAHREWNGTLHSYISFNRTEEWVKSIDFSNPAAAKAQVAKEFEGWAPELRALILDGEPHLYPVRSTRCPRITSGRAWLV